MNVKLIWSGLSIYGRKIELLTVEDSTTTALYKQVCLESPHNAHTTRTHHTYVYTHTHLPPHPHTHSSVFPSPKRGSCSDDWVDRGGADEETNEVDTNITGNVNMKLNNIQRVQVVQDVREQQVAHKYTHMHRHNTRPHTYKITPHCTTGYTELAQSQTYHQRAVQPHGSHLVWVWLGLESSRLSLLPSGQQP